MKKATKKPAHTKRDFLSVASVTADGDLRTLLEFILGHPRDEREVRNAIARLLLRPSCTEREVAAHLLAGLFNPQQLPRPEWAVCRDLPLGVGLHGPFKTLKAAERDAGQFLDLYYGDSAGAA